MSGSRRWRAGAAGLGAVGVIAGRSTARRAVNRRARLADPHHGEDFGVFEGDRTSVLTTPDGVDLKVREVGPSDARVTVVFAHGFCNSMRAYHFQRRDMTEVWGDQVRMVFYDQRGHGESTAGRPRDYTIEQLGRDLETVLTVLAPRGEVVLVGHSMGGMTVLSHARQYPDRYGRNIVGAAIISSAAEGISRSPLGEILQNPALEAARFTARYVPGLVHRGRGLARSILAPVLQAASFGDEAVSPTVVRYTEDMTHTTPVPTMVGFLHALGVHNETAGLIALARIPTLIACGTADVLTTPEHSEDMASMLPKAELLLVDGAGHMVQLEQPEIVNEALERLVARVGRKKLTVLAERLRFSEVRIATRPRRWVRRWRR
ncbi:alpha/beta fold hydrolase [Mycolicibacterium brumae]|uniref:Alpha/beta hydrolase n=1 Tax=Mycolicibacterium brumae TaxID=85968 RepID=A0A2G5PHJ5_9MYCO|nr:alpha/beta hydrolase [Mycolicibacterium brumae]MCV7194470.1 alpha/beta hydrolase [Mycolicibacterium brumae]PIB77781.1 alpha/beta hydrolase [Mycolicibacterium brumae]UWW10005.1 alpha/beta hydrolase [Mycolicibacterium brumae]